MGSVTLRGLVCNLSHTEEYSHTEVQSEQRIYLTQRRGGIWRFKRIFSESRSLSEFWESATVGRSPFPPFSSLRPGAAPSVPSVPLCETFSLRSQNFSAPLRETSYKSA